MVSALSSFDIHHVVSDLQFLIGAKIEKVFETTKPAKDFLFSLHVPRHGKEFLYLSLPSLFCLSSFKPVFPDVPPHFCASLRRKITNARITGISQVGFERIIRIDLSTAKGDSHLLIEMFASGNVLLLDDTDKILSVYQPKIWNEQRRILPNQTYAFPPAQIDPYSISKEDFFSLLDTSEKDSLVTFLAISCSLGGVYAKEVLARASLDDGMVPASLDIDGRDTLFVALRSLLDETTTPTRNDTRAFPVTMTSVSALPVDTSFARLIGEFALADLQEAQVTQSQSSSKSALSKYDKIIQSQTKQLEKMEIQADEAQKKAELLYTNYSTVDLLLRRITELRKEKSWKEIKVLASDVPLIDRIDETNGLIYIDLEDE